MCFIACVSCAFLALAATSPIASAGPNEGGTLIVHSTTQMSYTTDVNFCGGSSLSTCESAQTNLPLEQSWVWWITAAFPFGSSPRLKGINLGITYDNPWVVLVDWGCCADFEIFTANWPDPDTGTGMSWNEPQANLLTDVYWFAGYTYSAPAPGFCARSHPTQETIFVDDSVPAVEDPIADFGCIGFGANPGYLPCPEPLLSACCHGQACLILEEDDCVATGGVWLQGVTSCAPNPCLEYACCVEQACFVVREDVCVTMGGEWLAGVTSCSPNPCAEYACCVEQTCLVLRQADCITAGGNWLAGATSCGMNPCAELEVVHDWDFSMSDQAFTKTTCAADALPAWEYGTMNCGPDPSREVWGTGLGGLYPNNAGEGLSSPSFVVESSDYRLEVDHFYDTEIMHDGCNVTVGGQLIHPVVGYTGPIGSIPGHYAWCVGGESGWTGESGGQWRTDLFDLSPFQNQEIAVEFDFGSDDAIADTGCFLGAVRVLGTPPAFRILSITDVGNDQGREVRVRWTGHPCDPSAGDSTVTHYSLWRRIDDRCGEQAAAGLEASGVNLTFPPGDWDFVGTVPAYGESAYATVCPTLCDSTIAGGMCWSVFFVRAGTADPRIHFDAFPRSGYSVDNLAPSPPGDLRFETPDVLAWDESQDEDFDYFSVYGSAGPGFDETVLIGHTSATSIDVSGASFGYYHVTATDFSGNEGEEASIAGASRVPDPDSPMIWALREIRPNPFSARTFIAYDLPRTARVTLHVFDAAGRRIRTLVDELQAPGKHTAEWGGLDDMGVHVDSGIYFLQLRAGDFSARERLIILK